MLRRIVLFILLLLRQLDLLRMQIFLHLPKIGRLGSLLAPLQTRRWRAAPVIQRRQVLPRTQSRELAMGQILLQLRMRRIARQLRGSQIPLHGRWLAVVQASRQPDLGVALMRFLPRVLAPFFGRMVGLRLSL
jgi:hypothetical protein